MVNDSKEKIQRTMVIIKPDGIVKSLTGNILTRLSEAKLNIMGAKVMRVSRELAEKHYAHLKSHPEFDSIIDYIQGKIYGAKYERVMVLVYEGENAIEKVRKICGKTNPEEADPTSIRGQYGRITSKGTFENVIHSSGSEEEAEVEIKLWFEPEEIVGDIYPTETREIKVKKKFWKQA